MSNISLSDLIEKIKQLHDHIRDAVVTACEEQALEALSEIAADDEGDTIYAVDRVSEELLVEALSVYAEKEPIVLIAEGIEGGSLVLPQGAKAEDARWRIIVDPIDGTRGIMYQKRSAWILTGIAPNKGEATSLRDIVAAVQTEIPLVKQHLADQCWALKGEGVQAQRYNRVNKTWQPLQMKPSQAQSIAHGFAMISRFFPGVRDELAAIDEEVVLAALGKPEPGKASCFEDQYLSSGGQLFELMVGHDRFVADIRPLMEAEHERRGMRSGICCHPYDVCTLLIAEELGVIVTDAAGNPLDAPLNVDADVAWVGYANAHIQEQIQGALTQALTKRGLILEVHS